MGNSSPTGEVPVAIRTLDGTVHEVLCDIGIQNGKDLAGIVGKMLSLELVKFRLIFNGCQIHEDASETLLQKGFHASGGPTVVHLVRRDTANSLVSLQIERRLTDTWLLSFSRMDGSLVCSLEVNPDKTLLKDVRAMVAKETVGAGLNPTLQLLFNDCKLTDGGKTIGELCEVSR